MPSATWQSVNTSEIIIQVLDCQVADLSVPETLFWNFQILWFPGIHEEFVPGLPQVLGSVHAWVAHRKRWSTVCPRKYRLPPRTRIRAWSTCGYRRPRADCNSRSGCFVFSKAKKRNHFMTSHFLKDRETFWKVKFSWWMCDLFIFCDGFQMKGNQSPESVQRRNTCKQFINGQERKEMALIVGPDCWIII